MTETRSEGETDKTLGPTAEPPIAAEPDRLNAPEAVLVILLLGILGAGFWLLYRPLVVEMARLMLGE